MTHYLVIGGTGMLRSVCKKFADEGHVVSVVASNHEHLLELIHETREAAGLINPVLVDYTKIDALQVKLIEAIAHLGPVAVAVNWIRSDAIETRQAVVSLMEDSSNGCRLFEVFSSKDAKSSQIIAGDKEIDNKDSSIKSHRVVLGWKTENGVSRWLTDGEICSGLLNAISSGSKETIIGSIEPWSARP